MCRFVNEKVGANHDVGFIHKGRAERDHGLGANPDIDSQRRTSAPAVTLSFAQAWVFETLSRR
jgi:hypothetical protein